MPVEIIARQSVVDVLEHRLRDDILGGAHAPGELLPPERELAAGYGVTRTTLKHALSRLEQAGLLSTRHGIGTRVRDFLRLGGADLLPMLAAQDRGWLAEIFEVRRHIGALIARRAADRRTDRQARRLRDLLDEIAAAADGDAAQLAEAEVHRELARATGNRVYLLLTNTLFNAYLPVRAALRAPFEDPAAAAARLAPVVAAVADGRAVQAGTAAEAYLAETERLMLGALQAGREG
ncbi:putative HTH-type transcriptional regulator [Kitasatospora herbaricolor]|uniref:FadR/GntR family transcriptional regulator n=1 Tax=Kitasatospora herbaricolor TaxID=68217 RepID=UPI00174A325C|nr:GntR family transcriptional regulator [Kitasatospora herbaricolor]MDQ0313287.1 DNA-binding FadR family transcriptional regulator [Kitasatospora herbaricolor]GGV20002.1 putative HTH-type transcriptional regulator [Kitasatospora herbaricolor]